MASAVMSASSATTTSRPPTERAVSAFSVLVSMSLGAQSSTRSLMPSGPNRVKSGTAMAPRLMAPNSAA
jgi:hypothetical protein